MKTIRRKSPNDYVICNKVPITKSPSSRTSKIVYLDKDFQKVTDGNECAFVRKRASQKRYVKIMSREIDWLKRLENFDRVPNFVKRNKHSFIMTYLGARACKSNLPKDWQNQVKYICEVLDSYKCNHNDLKFAEILVKEDKINLVDFQWATSTEEELLELNKLYKRKIWVPGRFIPNFDVLWVKCSIIEEYG